ncbi:MAG TPA: tRNA-(ms[2]io[6]A)-hydroxylase [Saprospiraceae bacterium]|nr:tRNA-(ms[2]io[6]A)-hydroxylase [Saprospiraceae bacterium]
MKLRMDVAVPTSSAWVEAVMKDFNSFLISHAECERKAYAMAMSFVAKYPDRTEIIPELIDIGIEELEHFRDVYQLMAERNLLLPHKIAEFDYAAELVKLSRSTPDERFLDRLMIASVMETRGGERFRLVEEALEPGPLKTFYKELWTNEAKHGDVFVKMALNYFSEEQVAERLKYFNEIEGNIVVNSKISARLL